MLSPSPCLPPPHAQDRPPHHMSVPASSGSLSARMQGVASTPAPTLQASAPSVAPHATGPSNLVDSGLDVVTNVIANAVGSSGLGAVGVVASAAVRLLRAGRGAGEVGAGDAVAKASSVPVCMPTTLVCEGMGVHIPVQYIGT